MPQPAARWYEIHAAASAADEPTRAEILIYGNIGDRWDENGVVAAEFVQELAALEVEHIDLRINSYGGSVTEGFAIYNALARHRAQVAVHIDGIAASVASYIAMAGNTITMAENAQLMIHAPWGMAIGNAPELRAIADVLDRHARGMAAGYAHASGRPLEDCLALLTDGKDHWYSAQDALAEGFVSALEAPLPIAAALAAKFDLTRFNHSPAASAALQRKEQNMRTPQTPTDSQSNPADQAADAAATSVAPFARSRAENEQVIALFRPFLDRHPDLQALQTACLTDPALRLEDVRAQLLDTLGAGASPANPAGHAPRVEVVEDELDKRRVAVSAALLVRAGLGDDTTRAALTNNPFRGARLLDIARGSLERAGVRHAGMSQMEIVAAAFTTSTSDFPVLLENTMHKSLLRAYAAADLTWPKFCMRGSVGDFRAHTRYRTGSFGNLDTVSELNEFTNKSVPDGQKATITATTKGNVVNLSRQAIINDDLGAFVGLTSALGRAAARTVEAAVYALLAENSGLGPTMSDSAVLFHSNHANIGTGGALSVTTIEDARVKLASQTDVSGVEYLDLRPAVLLVPMASGGTARVINNAEYDPDTASKLQRPNMVRGLFREVVDTPRLSGTRFYVFADPSDAPVIEVAFLDGQDAPYLELQNGFDVDGARYKVRLDFGVAALDWRGTVTNAGA